MRSPLAAELLTYDQEQAVRRVCRTFKDGRNSWHMWLIDAENPEAVRCVEWILDLSACAQSMEVAAQRGIDLQIHTDAIVAAASRICPLRIDHTFSDLECAARFLDNVERDI
jgi:hypothetical protein